MSKMLFKKKIALFFLTCDIKTQISDIISVIFEYELRRKIKPKFNHQKTKTIKTKANH